MYDLPTSHSVPEENSIYFSKNVKLDEILGHVAFQAVITVFRGFNRGYTEACWGHFVLVLRYSVHCLMSYMYVLRLMYYDLLIST